MRKSFLAMIIGITALLAVTFFISCQSLKSVVHEPALSIHSVTPTKINFTGVELLCKVNVKNPNYFDIPFPNIDWQLFVNANSFIKGAINPKETIKSRKTIIVDVPVSFSYANIFNTFKSLQGTDQAKYKVTLAAKFELPLLGGKVWNLEREGVFPVLQIPKLSAPSLKIDKLDFTKANLLFTINVENPNKFDLPSPKIAYDYLVNNNSYIKSSMTAVPLAAAAVTPVIIGLTVNYADLYRMFQNLRTMGEAPGLLSIEGDFGIPALANNKFASQAASSLPLLKAPVISFAGISVKSLSLTRIDFEIAWEVENNNSFAMRINDMFYSLMVNNSQWGSGKVPSSTQIAANRKTRIPLEISFSSGALFNEITRIITGGTDVSFACNGNISLGAALPGLNDYDNQFNFNGTTRLRRP